MAIVKGANGAVLGETLPHGIYTGKHKRCIVCAKKAAHDLTLDDALCMKCDDALERWMKSDHYTCGAADVPAWIARRVRAHERGKLQTRLDRAFNAGVNWRLIGKPSL